MKLLKGIAQKHARRLGYKSLSPKWLAYPISELIFVVLFGKVCTPEDPVGPCMVSSEGACAAAWKYQVI